jgi:hypothetical protein
MPNMQLTVIKSYGWLTIPSHTLQQVIIAAEHIFQCNEDDCLSSSDTLQLLLSKSCDLLKNHDISVQKGLVKRVRMNGSLAARVPSVEQPSNN